MTSTTARVAVQLEPAALEEVQRAARILLAHPLVTDQWPRQGALIAIRRWEPVLRAEFDRVLGYRLDVGRTCARLYRRPAALAANRGPFTAAERPRPLGPLACSFFCLVLAAAESLGDQTTASRVAEEVQRLRAGDDALPVDLTQPDQRRAFVDALKWLEARGVFVLRDGEIESWAAGDGGGDALYDLDQDVVSRLLVASPSVLRDVDLVSDFLSEPVGPSDDARTRALRHRVARRIVTEPVVSLADLDPAELAHFRHRRTRIVADLERLTGAQVEMRAEGVLLIDGGDLSADAFPGTGTETQAALLWGAELVEVAAAPDPSEAGDPVTPWSLVTRVDADAAWDGVVSAYRSRFRAEYRDDPQRLRRAVERTLVRFGLLQVDDDQLRCHAAMARYRPEPVQETAPAPGLVEKELDLWGRDA